MNRTVVARILKVNHGGEHGAIRIYRAQIAVAGLTAPSLLPFLRETIAHEREHEQRFRSLMPARRSRPCRLMWLWGMGGTVLGAATALLGRVGVAVCTEAVERTVHRHLDEQLAFIGDSDPELTTAIREVQTQELGQPALRRGRPRPAHLADPRPGLVGVHGHRGADLDVDQRGQRADGEGYAGRRGQPMSYCRFSASCDLYCYESSAGGWDIWFHDGERHQLINEPTLQAFYDRLLTMRGAGYRFPDRVLEEVRAEMAGQ